MFAANFFPNFTDHFVVSLVDGVDRGQKHASDFFTLIFVVKSKKKPESFALCPQNRSIVAKFQSQMHFKWYSREVLLILRLNMIIN